MPDDIADRWVLLLDPMLGEQDRFPLEYSEAHHHLYTVATGGSACKAIEVLLDQGVLEERIIFLNLIASPEGLKNVCERFTKVKVISAWVDHQLDEKKYVLTSSVPAIRILLTFGLIGSSHQVWEISVIGKIQILIPLHGCVTDHSFVSSLQIFH